MVFIIYRNSQEFWKKIIDEFNNETRIFFNIILYYFWIMLIFLMIKSFVYVCVCVSEPIIFFNKIKLFKMNKKINAAKNFNY